MDKIRTKIRQLLIVSSRYARMDMFYVVKNGFWVTSGKAINSVLSLGLVIAFANLLPKETYGLYRYILSLGGVLNMFTLTGMKGAVARSVARGNEGVIRSAVRYQLKWNLLMLAAFLIMSGYYFINDNALYALSFLVLGIFMPFALAINTYGAYLEGKREFKIAYILNVASTALYVVASLAAILFSGEVIWLVIAYAGSIFIAAFVSYKYILRRFNPPTTGESRETLTYGRNLSFIGLIGPLASQMDKIILAHFWGPAQLATYALAQAVPSRAVPSIKNLVNIGFPKFAAKTAQENNTVLYRRIFQGAFAGTIIALSYILIAPLLFKYLLPQYLDGILYSQILAISFIFAMPTRYVGLLFESQKMTHQVFINTIINSILALVLYIVFGIWGGIMGLAIANVLWSFLGFVVNFTTWKISVRS